MTASLVGLVALVALSLFAVLATGAVVARLAVHIRDEAWARISFEQRRLRRRERELSETSVCTCVRDGDPDRPETERNG